MGQLFSKWLPDKVAAQRYLVQFVSQSQADCYDRPIATGRQLSLNAALSIYMYFVGPVRGKPFLAIDMRRGVANTLKSKVKVYCSVHKKKCMTHGSEVAAAVAVVGVDLLWPVMVAAANKARVARARTRAADILKLNLNSKWRLFTLHSHTHTHIQNHSGRNADTYAETLETRTLGHNN